MCPHCKRKLPFLTTFSYPGFCSRCRGWLGTTVKGERPSNTRPVNASEKVRQISEVYSIGELLSCAVSFDSSPTLRDFNANLVECVERRANGSINVFSNLVGIWSGTVRRLLVGETKLSLRMLSQLCSRLNISPHETLFNRGNKGTLKERCLTFKQKTLHINARLGSQKIHQAQVNQPQVKQVVSWDQTESEFLAVRQENPPPSLEAIARRLGRHPSTLKRRFPEQCELIISRYWEYRSNRHLPPAKVRATLVSTPPHSRKLRGG
jgi:AraC-like DNA-binding protein